MVLPGSVTMQTGLYPLFVVACQEDFVSNASARVDQEQNGLRRSVVFSPGRGHSKTLVSGPSREGIRLHGKALAWPGWATCFSRRVGSVCGNMGRGWIGVEDLVLRRAGGVNHGSPTKIMAADELQCAI